MQTLWTKWAQEALAARDGYRTRPGDPSGGGGGAVDDISRPDPFTAASALPQVLWIKNMTISVLLEKFSFNREMFLLGGAFIFFDCREKERKKQDTHKQQQSYLLLYLFFFFSFFRFLYTREKARNLIRPCVLGIVVFPPGLGAGSLKEKRVLRVCAYSWILAIGEPFIAITLNTAAG